MFTPKKLYSRQETWRKRHKQMYDTYLLDFNKITVSLKQLSEKNSTSLESIFLNTLKTLKTHQSEYGFIISLYDETGTAIMDYNSLNKEVHIQQYEWYKYRHILQYDDKVKDFIRIMFFKHFQLEVEAVYYTNFMFKLDQFL